ncbi:MAG: BrnT family toxin, partial [Bdellovibrionota bacterium]
MMKFEWDDRKAEANQKKHGVSFELAVTVFDDPNALIAPDEKHSTPQETREWIIGLSDNGVLVV